MSNTSLFTENISPGIAPGQPEAGVSESSLAPEQQYRASAYGLLAALLRDIPGDEILTNIAAFARVAIDEDEMLLAMSSLGLAAQTVSQAEIRDEYQKLFIGLGRGELVPYASWYLTGYLMERPLSTLRDDLAALGLERDANSREPEDHIASLCEVMSILIIDSGDLGQQLKFFEKHLEPWCETFFQDMETAESASFYRSVGRFGKAFIAIDKQYLTMPV